MYDISYIMPAKNTSQYVSQMIDSIKMDIVYNWEIIIVDDHSEDDLYTKVSKLAENDQRLKIVKNLGIGKVTALNTGYNLSSGRIIKFVDSDDTLTPLYFDHIDEIMNAEVCCHDYNIVDNSLKYLSKYSMSKNFFNATYNEVLVNVISLPRAVWSFSRKIADLIFPLPVDLPYEDVWFSFIIKKHVKEIKYINKALYNYRQHENQTFGGVLNYSTDKVRFRANRLVTFLSVVKEDCRIMENINPTIFDNAIQYQTILGIEKLKWRYILFSKLTFSSKIKLIIFRKFNKLTPILKKIQWFFS